MDSLPHLARNALILIPTQHRPETLAFAIRSAQRQSFEDIDIVIIGDGVDDSTREVVTPFVHDDPRIVFIDMPKSVGNGEEYRDHVIRRSKASYVTYLADTDLLFPHHLEEAKAALIDVDFVNPLPVSLNWDGSLEYVPTDLSKAESVLWHVTNRDSRKSFPLTGVTHTRYSYIRLPEGWTIPPAGRSSEQYMWEKYFLLDHFTARTLPKATFARFADAIRTGLDPGERASEIGVFMRSMASPRFVEEWDARVQQCVHENSVRSFLEIMSLRNTLSQLLDTTSELTRDLEELRDESDAASRLLSSDPLPWPERMWSAFRRSEAS